MLNGFMTFLPIASTLTMILLPIFLFKGYHMMYFQDVAQIKMLLRLKCLSVLVGWLHGLHLSLLVGYQSIVQEGSNAIWMSPCKCLNQSFEKLIG